MNEQFQLRLWKSLNGWRPLNTFSHNQYSATNAYLNLVRAMWNIYPAQ